MAKRITIQTKTEIIITANFVIEDGDNPFSLMKERLNLLNALSDLVPETDIIIRRPTKENTTITDNI
jgi:hypothetical protein